MGCKRERKIINFLASFYVCIQLYAIRDTRTVVRGFTGKEKRGMKRRGREREREREGKLLD